MNTITSRFRSVRPLSVGGDHSITYPILKALGKGAPVGLVHIDAHCDTMGAYDGSKFHHGGPFRLAVLDGVLDPERTIQIGIRGSSNMFWEFSHASGVTVIYMEDFMKMGLTEVVALAREVVGDGPIYISIDVEPTGSPVAVRGVCADGASVNCDCRGNMGKDPPSALGLNTRLVLRDSRSRDSPPQRFVLSYQSPIIDEFIERVDRARTD